jgi:hypothetical protein
MMGLLTIDEAARGLSLKYALASIIDSYAGCAADINIWREAKWAVENGATPEQYEKILLTLQAIYNGKNSPAPHWQIVTDALMRDDG